MRQMVLSYMGAAVWYHALQTKVPVPKPNEKKPDRM